ncbi:hypothetical protein EVAR_39306_1 [Eumeta japonica]|uniref:Uncharacterized protein n=1 Tax=Eumeta variegata TaxID=151549 RepID=A0A4C1VVQ2_EUMVA|nr:hypothetical protein EVAR_39306_1 [Eumeta japonica]
MRVLERRFGRPDAIIKQELYKLRRMIPMNDGMSNISSFANKVNDYIAAMCTLNKLSYLSAPEMTDDKLLHQERTTREGHEESVQMTAVVTEDVAISANNVNTMRAYLKIIPIELYGPERSMKVHALLNEGSTVTLIDEQVAKGRRKTLHVLNVGGNEITDEGS